MALKSSSLFLYGYQVTASNQYLDFKASGGGSTLTAIVPLGYYSLGDLLTAIASAMAAQDNANTYTVTADRTLSSGTQNRITIATSGSFLSLLFASGPNTLANISSLIGFANTDRTGATTYTGTLTTGTALVTTFTGYTYTGATRHQRLFGTVNISTSGLKEAVVFPGFQQFITVTFKQEPESVIDSNWIPLLTWMIAQKPFEYTPEVNSPSTFYNVTLEKTNESGLGLEFMMPEQLPDFPFLYTIGPITMRINTL